MIGRYEIDVIRAHLFKLRKNIAQLLRRHLFAAPCPRDLIILAEHAAQRTAAEKDRPAPVPMRDGRLLKGMKIIFCYREPLYAAAAGDLFPICPAGNGAKPAFHRAIISSYPAKCNFVCKFKHN